MLTALLDRRLRQAAGWFLAVVAFTLCGVIHSPFKDGRLLVPWAIGELPPEAAGRGPLHMAVAYSLLAAIFPGWSVWLSVAAGLPPPRRDSDEATLQ